MKQGKFCLEFCQENALVIVNTLFRQHKRRLYTWTSSDSQHWNQTDYILSSQRRRSSIQSAKPRLGADCGSDNELLIAKFRLKLKKVGKSTRPFKMKESESELAQSCLTLCNPMDCSLPGFSIHWIFQARVLEWLAIAFSRGSSWPRDQTQVSHIAGRRFTLWATGKTPEHSGITWIQWKWQIDLRY